MEKGEGGKTGGLKKGKAEMSRGGGGGGRGLIKGSAGQRQNGEIKQKIKERRIKEIPE